MCHCEAALAGARPVESEQREVIPHGWQSGKEVRAIPTLHSLFSPIANIVRLFKCFIA